MNFAPEGATAAVMGRRPLMKGIPMRFISWNVNGLRAVLKKGFEDIVCELDADIAQRKGYSGTAVFSKREPLQVVHGLGVDELDTEGRIVALEFPELWFVDVYTPNAQAELARIDHRMAWDDAFRDFCKGLEAGSVPAGGQATAPKPVVMCGDFNVAHEEIDLKNPGPNRGKAGFSDEEREKFTRLLDAGFTDTFRQLHPDLAGAYSWWSYRFNARKNNAGWRIDYFLVSDQLAPSIESASIYNEVMGSDHCPVGLTLA